MDEMKLVSGGSLSRMDRTEAAALQTRLLREELAFCRSNSKFYSQRLTGLDLDHFTLDDLHGLPCTTKEELSAAPGDFTAVDEANVAELVFTSGTTGAACPIVFSLHDMKRLAWNEHRAFLLAGITNLDRILLTCTLDRCFIAGVAYYDGAHELGASTIRSGLNSIESHLQIFPMFHPTVVIGVPSFLRRLGTAAKESGVPTDSVRMLLCVGEPIRDAELHPTTLAKELASIWTTAELHSTYASTELVSTLCECPARRGGHVPEELAIMEILDENGKPVPDGQRGELVVTTLQLTGTPLLRFRTGDITFMTHEPCACGRTAPRVGPILGRRAQMLKHHGTTFFPQTLYSVLDLSSDILEYYISVEADSLLSDHVEVVAALRNPGDAGALRRIANELHVHCRVTIPVRESDVDSVRKKVYQTSRKPLRFFDSRPKSQQGALFS